MVKYNSFILLFVLVLTIVSVNAYGTSNPPVFGHSIGELENVQQRVTGTCNAGSSIRIISSTGTVTCETDDVGTSQWTTSGSNIYYNTGDVGIGTSAPSMRLHVSGGRARFDNGADIYSTLFLGQFSSSDCFIHTTGGSLSCGTLPGTSWTVSGNNQYSSVSGNVGIGTASPTEKLQVSGAGDTKAVVESTGSHAGIRLKSVADSWMLQEESSNKRFRIYQETGASPGEKFTLLSGGNVGIGTATPGYKLDVVGAAIVTDAINIRNAADGRVSYIKQNPNMELASSNDDVIIWRGGFGFGRLTAGEILATASGSPAGVNAGRITGSQFCIGASCISAWPAGGGGTVT